MSDSDVKALALFFFYASLDERRAMLASAEALEYCKSTLKHQPELNTRVLVIKTAFRFWKKHSKYIVRGRPQFSLESGWLVPKSFDFAAWKDFQKKAPEEEMLALIFLRILGFTEAEVASGLEITEGTLRFRVGKALRRLGELCYVPERDLKSVK